MPLTARRALRTFRYAVYFDGVDDYVANTAFSWSALQRGFTIALWLNPAVKTGDVLRHLSAPLGYFQIAYDSAPRRLYFATRSTDTSELLAIGTSADSVRPNVFTNAALTWNTAVGCWYVNGALDVCVSDRRSGKGMGYTGYYIGRSLFWGWFSGYVAQVLIYSLILSNSEIQWNYQHPDNPIRNGLVLWLQADPAYIRDINGDGVLEWIDLSGFGNHGKIYGARLVQLTKTPARALEPARVLPATR